MSQFLPLLVTDIHRTIRDAVVLTLQPEDPQAFAFKQGQYLTFRQACCKWGSSGSMAVPSLPLRTRY